MLSDESTPPAHAEGQKERFLEVVAAPLVKHVELQHAAKNVLRSMVVDANSLEEATRRMESESFRWKRWMLPLLGFAAVLVLAAPSLWQVVQFTYVQEVYFSGGYGKRKSAIPLVKPDIWKTSRLSPDEKLILVGDDDAPTDELRLKAVVDRFPDRPEFYAEYAEQCIRSVKNLPDDFETTVARIDPDNGYFFFLKAVEASQDSATLSYDGVARKNLYKSHAEREQQASYWWHRSMSAGSFRSYKKELEIRRDKLLPQREDLLTSFFALANQPWPSSVDLALESKSSSIIDEIESLGSPGQEERFRELLEDFRKVRCRIAEDERRITFELSSGMGLSAGLYSTAHIADKLSIEPEKSHLNELAEWVKKNYRTPPTRPTRALTSPAEDRMLERAPSLHSVSGNFLNLTPEESFPSNETLAPGRFAEHALWGRAASLMGVALLAALAWIMLLYRFRHGRLPRLVTHSLKKALRPLDYLWILLLGVGLPLLWHQAVRQSPWGGLDFSLQHGIEKLIAPQWGLLAFTVLMATTIAVRWRVKRRLSALNLGIGRSMFTWICLLLTAATMPLMQYWIANPSLPDESMLVAGAVPALWLVVSLTRGLFMPVGSVFGQLLVSRVTATSWLLACVVFAACAPIYYQVERHWVARDTLVQSPDFPNALEKQIVAEMNREDLELLDRMGK